MDLKAIKRRIREAVLRETELPEKTADDVAFHMTDWLDDLTRFNNFCNEPDKWNDKETKEMLLSFLVHVPEHIAAASMLFTGIPLKDVFKVGIDKGESDESYKSH